MNNSGLSELNLDHQQLTQACQELRRHKCRKSHIVLKDTPSDILLDKQN